MILLLFLFLGFLGVGLYHVMMYVDDDGKKSDFGGILFLLGFYGIIFCYTFMLGCGLQMALIMTGVAVAVSIIVVIFYQVIQNQK